jgi:hypothetical protein
MPANRTFGRGPGAVAAEVEEDDAVAVDDLADRLAVLGDDERGQVLVEDPGDLLAVGLDRLAGAGEQARVAADVRLPAALDDAPVSLVAVHRHAHAPAAGRDAVIHGAVGGERLEERLEAVHVEQRRGRRHVAAVEQQVDAGLLDALGLRLTQHRLEVVDMAVDVAVGEQADEMERGLVLEHAVGDLAPAGVLEDRAGRDGVADQRRALLEDPAAADGVVADLAVAHVLIARHADRAAVRLELGVDRVRLEPVVVRLHGALHIVAVGVLADADPVHDHQQHRALRPLKIRDVLQLFHVVIFLSRRATMPQEPPICKRRGARRRGENPPQRSQW